MKKITLAFLVVSSLLSASFAQSQGVLCAQHQREDGSWGGPYALPYIVVDGDTLNEAANTYKYYSFEYYAVATWPNGGYSAFTIPYSDEVSSYGYERVKDQDNRNYRIRDAAYLTTCPSY